MALVSLIVVAVFWASSSAREEDIQCSLAALVPPQQKLLADRLCRLEDLTIVMEHILQELLNRAGEYYTVLAFQHIPRIRNETDEILKNTDTLLQLLFTTHSS
uniref:Uncharacterized protein n=1 Tax=Parascaris equorum TaxID=6256 RepID=A0A914S102_PAREQ